MKKRLVIAIALMPVAVWAQSGSYTVKGKMGSLDVPAKAYLRYTKADKIQVDTVQIKKGEFEFKGSVESPQKAILFVDTKNAGIRKVTNNHIVSFYLEPGTIAISSPDSAIHASVKGASMNVDNEKLKVALKTTDEQMSKLMKEYQAATPEQRKSKEFEEAIDARYEAIQKDQKVIYGEFIKKNPASLVSLDALKSYGGYDPNYTDVEPLFAGLSSEVRNSVAGKKYAESLVIIKATSVGAMAPVFSQADTLGKMVSLADFKGKYVLLDFWASWCGPCRQENPNVVANFEKYKDKNFTILGVSLDQPTGKEAWLKAIHKDNLTWTHVSDLKFWDNEAAKQYGVRSIPQNFLLDPTGKIIAKNIRGKALGEKLAEVLASNP
ncbi:MAG: TlpA disulfide reductase family protein [Siphonobacter sp.]